MSPTPFVLLSISGLGWLITGMIVREMMFHCAFKLMGTTGSILRMFASSTAFLKRTGAVLSLSCRASQILLVISRTRLSSYYPIIGVTNDFSGSCLHPSQRRIYP